MIKIFSAENLQSAHLLQGLLAESGIKTQILNQYAQGGVGELPFTHTYPEIWLENDADMPRAQSIIVGFEQRAREISDLICPACQEPCPDTFEVCWRCGTRLTTSTEP